MSQGWLPACKKRASSGPPPAVGQPLPKRASNEGTTTLTRVSMGGDFAAATAVQQPTQAAPKPTPTVPTVPAPVTVTAPRVPTFAGPVDEKLYNVATSVQGTRDVSEPCQGMLYGLCFGSLGPAQGERDDLQQEACGLIGRALSIKEAYLADLVRDAEQKVLVEQQKYDELNHVHTAAQATKDATAVEVKEKIEVKRRLQFQVEEAKVNLQRAKEAHTKADLDLSLIMKEKTALDDAYYKRFLLLKEGGLTEPIIKEHLGVLNPLLNKWGAEDSLIASFGKAVRHDVRERMRWSEVTIVNVEEFFHQPREEVEKRVLTAKSYVEQCMREVEAMQHAYEQALADVEAASAAVLAAQSADDKAAQALQAAKMALAQQGRVLQGVQGEVQKRSLDLKHFQEGPIADYQYLLGHTKPERYSSRPGKSPPLDADAASKVKVVTHALETCDPNAVCKQMLAGAAPGSLGIAPRSRDEFQSAVVGLIARALSTRESHLCSYIGDSLEGFDSVDFTDMNSLKHLLQSAGLQNPCTGVAAAEKLVQEKCDYRLKHAQQYLAEKKAAMDKASHELAAYDKELQVAMRNKQHYDDAFNKLFVPIRDGTATGSVTGSIEQLTQLLKSFKCEDCLIACFKAAALHMPADRGAWCTETVTEVERAFDLPMRQAEEMALQCKEAVQQRRMMLESLKNELDEAQHMLKVAQEQCRIAKKVHSQTMDLKEFRVGPLEFVRH